MPATHHSEAALARRREKYEHAVRFPGLLRSWAEAAGKTVAAVGGTPETPILIFTDGCFLVGRPGPAAGDELLHAILGVRALLAAHHGAAYEELDQRIQAEREAMRLARMEKVVGAVQTNLPQIPELRAELRKVLAEEGGDGSGP